MASSSTAAAKSRKLQGELTVGDFKTLRRKIINLKKEIQEEKDAYLNEKFMQNKKKMERDAAQRLALAASRSDANRGLVNKLSLRMQNPFVLPEGSYDKDLNNLPEASIPVTAKLPMVEKIPPFTTWISLKRNQRTIDNRSVIGKPHIGNEQFGGKPLVCSDDEEANDEPARKAKYEFSDGEKRIIRMVYEDYEPSEKLLQFLTQFIGGTTSEIYEVFNMLKKEDEEKLNQDVSVPAEVEHGTGMLLDKSLASCLSFFDTLFCRQCLVFDCGIHLYSQPTITPAERVESPLDVEDDGPCSDQCYLLQPRTAMTYPEIGGSSNIGNARTSGECPYASADQVDNINDNGKEGTKETAEVPVVNQASNVEHVQAEGSPTVREWKRLEKDLYLKGLEMFGRNSCLITSNLLSGLRTCIEVYNYMHDVSSTTELAGNRTTGVGDKEKEMVLRTELVGRKGKAKKVKRILTPSGRASAGRIAGRHPLGKHYTPCTCQPMCGKECPCLKNSTCCEKYCGCSKRCKNRFRGCQCAAGQCRSQQCPCVAAGRECDPDICGNCWVSCDDGSSGEPPKNGEGPCGNMRMLLRQKERIMLGKSDVVGWGAFVKDAVKKDDYLGEYTGELISHEEADRRGKYYDRANKSFLFNLNEELVLDAYRGGNKLKFANHSSKPNCYAKILTVGGDHRVAIFAKEDLEAGQEIFYDYSYKPEQTPIWAQEPNG